MYLFSASLLSCMGPEGSDHEHFFINPPKHSAQTRLLNEYLLGE